MPSAQPRKRTAWSGKICRRASNPPRISEPGVARRPGCAVTRHAFFFACVAFAAAPGHAAPASQAEGEHGMVVTAQHEASSVGVGILAAGGNAVDAAVAVGYA